MRLTEAEKMLLADDFTSTSDADKQEGCYICRDPYFAQAGLPLCRICPKCTSDPSKGNGHIPADDCVCTVCGYDEYEGYGEEEE